ncbi:ATP-grasp domain-containing protein [Segatella maculosa]|uniref:ATP-grasp domain-containing protein n=1 Tax=Segatella maculosa TaxID=439703 RepID=UPI0023F3C0FA|nr:ATP-grasp domain-containing protein [Segatella maculosa]
MNNILITSAGQRVTLVQIFQHTFAELQLEGKVFTTDMVPRLAPAGYVSDRCFKVCRCTDPMYIDKLLELCQAHDIKIIIPTIDTELMVLARNKRRFKEAGIDVIVSDEAFIKACRDKRNTMELFDKMKIAYPKPIDKFRPVFPLFAKPYDGSLSTNLHVIRSQEEMTEEIMNDPKLLFMQYVDPKVYKEFTVDLYYGKDYRLKCIVPRERIKIRAGEINKGITRKNAIVPYLYERMATIPGAIGTMCIQLFYREADGEVLGIEINPRFGGGYPLTYYAKANYAEYIIREYLLGETIAYSEDWIDKTLMLRYDKDVIVYEK